MTTENETQSVDTSAASTDQEYISTSEYADNTQSTQESTVTEDSGTEETSSVEFDDSSILDSLGLEDDEPEYRPNPEIMALNQKLDGIYRRLEANTGVSQEEAARDIAPEGEDKPLTMKEMQAFFEAERQRAANIERQNQTRNQFIEAQTSVVNQYADGLYEKLEKSGIDTKEISNIIEDELDDVIAAEQAKILLKTRGQRSFMNKREIRQAPPLAK